MTLVLSLIAGVLIGLSLGTLVAGGSILAVPVLLAMGQSPGQATTGSLVVVGTTAFLGVLTARREGHVHLGRGVAFGVVAIGGATLGATASTRVPEAVLLGSLAALLLLVGGLLGWRQWRHTRVAGDRDVPRPSFDDPIISFREGFMCDCPRALKILVTATVVGLLTGFLGVGGGFLVVPALVLALGMSMTVAAGTSLVVIAVTSLAALVVRIGVGVAPDWPLVGVLTAAAAVGGIAGAGLADRIDGDRLAKAFTFLILTVGACTAVQAVPALT